MDFVLGAVSGMSPKFVGDGKKYGRRSKPDNHGSDTPLDFADLSDIEMEDSYASPATTPVGGVYLAYVMSMIVFLAYKW